MATINYSLSAKTDAIGRSEILIRFTHNDGVVILQKKQTEQLPFFFLNHTY